MVDEKISGKDTKFKCVKAKSIKLLSVVGDQMGTFFYMTMGTPITTQDAT